MDASDRHDAVKIVTATPEQMALMEGVFPEQAAKGWRCLGVVFTTESGEQGARSRERDRPWRMFRRAGSHCDVIFDGGPLFHLRDTYGTAYLDRLLHSPNQPMRAFRLEQMVDPRKGEVREENPIHDEEEEGEEGELADTGEKARNNVRVAIQVVVRRLRRGSPTEQAFARHIGAFVSLGYNVMYHLPDGREWE